MPGNRMRGHQHSVYFTEYELKAIEPVLIRLGKKHEDLTRSEILQHLQVVHSLSRAGRDDAEKVLAGLRISTQALSTFLRYEMQAHCHDAGFRQRVDTAVNGVRESSAPDERKGLRGLLDEITAFVEREARRK